MNETKTKDGLVTDEVIERLRKEREQESAEWIEAGGKEGREWAVEAGYGELKDYALKAAELVDEPTPVWNETTLPDDMDDTLADCRKGEWGDGFDYGAFAQGFHRGVLAVWEEIKARL